MSQEIQRSMAHGAAWMVLFKLLERSLGAISTLILVRLLAPKDFGIVAMATSFIAMAELLSAFGFDVALIQKQDAPEEHYHTAWTLNALMGLAITVAMVVLAKPVAAFYKEPGLFWVVLALALGPAITGCENVGVLAFRKELNFRREFRFQISRKLAGFSVVVPLAFWLHSYWALVAGTLAGKLAGTVMSYRIHPFRPRFSLASAGTLFHFSKWLLLSNFFGFLKMRASDFLIGRLQGPGMLGLYNVSAEFANLPTTELGAPINRVLLPGFARIGNDTAALSSAYINAIGFVAMIVVPAAAGIFSVANFLVPVILGAKWAGAAPLLKLLALNGAMTVIEGGIYTMLLAIGYPHDVTRVNGVYVAVQISLMFLLVTRFGAVGAAYATLCGSACAAPFFLYFLRKHTGIPFSAFLRAVIRPVAAAVLMVIVLSWGLSSRAVVVPGIGSAAWLLGAVFAGACVYMTVLIGIWYVSGRPEGPERLAFDRVRTELRARLGV
ncbi:polysaccharide biosynthesis protein [Burkholderiales bacterium GJ-E10]|nr:polysaccharide biosynthesis protein [Burkholderiales bacterium GJ-E10]